MTFSPAPALDSVSFSSVNGVVDGQLPVTDRGLAFGDGVFETLRVVDGTIPLWPLHLDRLQQGLLRLAIALPPERLTQTRAQLDAYLAEASERSGTVKLIVTRGCSGGGYQYPEGISANVIMTYRPWQSPKSASQGLMICATPVYENPHLAGIKHLSRLENVLARQEVEAAGYEDGVLMDRAGYLVETINSNLFLYDAEGEVVTPSLRHCGVAGIARRLLREVYAPAVGLNVVVRDVTLAELPQFVGAFKTNSITGASQVVSIGDHDYGNASAPIDLAAFNLFLHKGALNQQGDPR